MVGHRPVSPLNVTIEISRFGTCITNYNPSAFFYFWCTKIQNKKVHFRVSYQKLFSEGHYRISPFRYGFLPSGDNLGLTIFGVGFRTHQITSWTVDEK